MTSPALGVKPTWPICTWYKTKHTYLLLRLLDLGSTNSESSHLWSSTRATIHWQHEWAATSMSRHSLVRIGAGWSHVPVLGATLPLTAQCIFTESCWSGAQNPYMIFIDLEVIVYLSGLFLSNSLVRSRPWLYPTTISQKLRVMGKCKYTLFFYVQMSFVSVKPSSIFNVTYSRFTHEASLEQIRLRKLRLNGTRSWLTFLNWKEGT